MTLRPAVWPPMQTWRLSSRMVMLSLLLLLLVQALGFVAIHTAVQHNARTALSDELRVGERVWARLLDQRAATLSQGAALLAADYGFRSAVASNDQATITSALENHGARIDASLVALLDTDFAVRAQSKSPSQLQPLPSAALAQPPNLAALVPRLAPQLATQLVKAAAVVSVVDGKPYQFVMVPMRAPVLIGWVLMGFELDRSVVDDLHAVVGLHATLVMQPARVAAAAAAAAPARASLVASVSGHSSLPDAGHAAALAALPPAPSPADRPGPLLPAGLLRSFVIDGVIAGVGAVLVFLTCMKELPATLLLQPLGSATLATEMWTQTGVAAYSAAAPYAALLVLLSALPTYLLGVRTGALDRGRG